MSLDFTPVVLDDHTIHVKIHFEKSSPDPTHRITIGRETAPVLLSLVLDTEGDYKSGKTVLLRGGFPKRRKPPTSPKLCSSLHRRLSQCLPRPPLRHQRTDERQGAVSVYLNARANSATTLTQETKMQKLLIALALLTAVDRGLGQQYTAAPTGARQSNAEHLNAAKKQEPAKDKSQPQVILRVRVIEISRTKLQELGLDFSRASSEPALPESLTRVVDALRQVGVARILAEPVIASLCNQTASLEVGSHARVAVRLGCGKTEIQNEFHGTSVDFTPEVLNDKKIHIKLRIELCHPDKAHPPTEDGEFGPMFRTAIIISEGDYESGETHVLHGGLYWRDDSPAQAAADRIPEPQSEPAPLLQAEKADDILETLYFLTPEIVSPTTSKTAATAQTRR